VYGYELPSGIQPVSATELVPPDLASNVPRLMGFCMYCAEQGDAHVRPLVVVRPALVR
jgi:hypothetical protein